jgi:hypothetical protein
MQTFARITGVEELDDALSYLRDKSAKRIGKACAGKMATVTAKAIRNYVPASLAASVNMASDKGIGSRNSKPKISTIQGAKAGVSVGSAYKSASKFTVVNRGKRKGVGISARNLHWFAMGTADRWTGSKRNRSKVGPRRISTGKPVHFTGRIDKAKWGGFVQRGAEAAKGPALEAARQQMEKMIAAEAAMARGVGF